MTTMTAVVTGEEHCIVRTFSETVFAFTNVPWFERVLVVCISPPHVAGPYSTGSCECVTRYARIAVGDCNVTMMVEVVVLRSPISSSLAQ